MKNCFIRILDFLADSLCFAGNIFVACVAICAYLVLAAFDEQKRRRAVRKTGCEA